MLNAFLFFLFQVLILFVALGVFLLRVREAFVENSLVDVRELREIFMIIGGTYNTVITSLIVSITKFSIVIGSPGAYLSRNRRAITWVSSCRRPI